MDRVLLTAGSCGLSFTDSSTLYRGGWQQQAYHRGPVVGISFGNMAFNLQPLAPNHTGNRNFAQQTNGIACSQHGDFRRNSTEMRPLRGDSGMRAEVFSWSRAGPLARAAEMNSAALLLRYQALKTRCNSSREVIPSATIRRPSSLKLSIFSFRACDLISLADLPAATS